MHILLYAGKYEGHLILKRLIKLGRKPAHLFVLKGTSNWERDWSKKIIALAGKNGIECSVGASMNSETVGKIIAQYKPCLFFFSNCRQLLTGKTIELIDFPVNFHNSLLPAYRGFAPNTWPIINGDKFTGTTMLRIVSGAVDSGPIIAQKRIAIRKNDTGWDLEKRLAELNVKLMEQHLPSLLEGRVDLRSQDETKATYACKRIPDDGLVQWTWPGQRICNLIRALTRPYPGAFTFFRGRKLYLWQAEEVNKPPDFAGRIPGAVVKVGRGPVLVLCGDGVCKLAFVQLEGEPVRQTSEVLDTLDIRLGGAGAG